ncbi:MAG: nuclear transport factor 2 family protein [Clostridia bacterium]|nr:nuclear transport factor 2 family protein [Clostridia bacterium]
MNEILFLEKSLFKHEYISNGKWLENTIHDKFAECGKSGLLYNKKGIVKFLLSCSQDRDITICNFECEKVDDNTWLVHYITKSNNGELYYRTSIWVKDNNLKLLYHQATKLNVDVELTEF